MQITTNRTVIITALLICVGLFATCEFTKQVVAMSDKAPSDTLFLSQWRREKVEKLSLISHYENKLAGLQKSNDSLCTVVAEKKQRLEAYRFKERFLLEQLKDRVNKPDSFLTARDSISVIVDSLSVANNQNDFACDETINALQSQVANRDSSIILQRQVETNLRDLQKEQDLRNQYLTDQLNTAYKNQRKKTRQNKVMAGLVMLLSGISTSLLLTQSLK